MPIILKDNIPFVVKRSEFLDEYNKVKLTVNDNNSGGLIFEISVFALTELFMKSKEIHQNDPISRLYSFNYFETDAQDIVLEVLLFHSVFYNKIKLFNSNDATHNIENYLCNNKRIHFQDYMIQISSGKISCKLLTKSIKRIFGLINNFIICTDYYSIHFCSDISFGKFIKVIPINFENLNNYLYDMNCFDYVLERNLPSKIKLWKYRKKGFLVLIQ